MSPPKTLQPLVELRCVPAKIDVLRWFIDGRDDLGRLPLKRGPLEGRRGRSSTVIEIGVFCNTFRNPFSLHYFRLGGAHTSTELINLGAPTTQRQRRRRNGWRTSRPTRSDIQMTVAATPSATAGNHARTSRKRVVHAAPRRANTLSARTQRCSRARPAVFTLSAEAAATSVLACLFVRNAR